MTVPLDLIRKAFGTSLASPFEVQLILYKDNQLLSESFIHKLLSCIGGATAAQFTSTAYHVVLVQAYLYNDTVRHT